MTGRPYLVISSDNHAGADILVYRDYLESKWHEEFDRWAPTYVNPWDFVEPDPESDEVRSGVTSGVSSLSWDSERRVADLESEGIVAEVIFPNTVPPFLPGNILAFPPPADRADYERRWAGLKAHNRWLADFCSDLPGRRAGVAQIMLFDVADAVAEIEACREMGMTGGILLPSDSPPNGLQSLYYPKYEPIWAACAALDVPVHRHTFPAGEPITRDTGVGAGPASVLEAAFFQNRCLSHLIFAGVFERNPTLKFVSTETGSGWVPEALAALDALCASGRTNSARANMLNPSLRLLSMKPSEYFARNCYLGASLLLHTEVDRRYEIGVDRIMWGGDYPHSEGTYPFSRAGYQVSFEGVPEGEIRQMLGDTAAEVYGFDKMELQAHANAVGPTVDEVHEVLRDGPRVPEDSVSPVFVAGASRFKGW